MEYKRHQYGLFTAITMIVGIVIGSGIFFKCDDVLIYTGGNVWIGVIGFCIGAFSIIFGSLTITELSVRTEKNGGAVGYFEDFISKKMACGFGWFQTFVYYPTISAVVCWVSAIYTCSLIGYKATLEAEILIGYAILIVIYAVNILSIKFGGYFQNLSTIVKLVPLLIIAFVGIFYSPTNIQLPQGVEFISKSNVGIGWLAALAPIAFSFDGWIIATSVTNEVRNPQKNMTIALVIGPFIVLGVYLLYFLGLNHMLGAEYIMSTGNNAVNKAGELLFGSNGTKLILIAVIIAILGVLNGITLGNLRMPQALASKNMLPNSKNIVKINDKIHLSINSCILSLITTSAWLFIHYITQKNKILGNGDISEIAIVFSYICYVFLYIKVIKMAKEKVIKSFFKGFICPTFGLIGSIIILIGGITSNPTYVPLFIIFSALIMYIGLLYYKHNNSINKS